MTPEDFSYFQSRVTRFISGSSSGMKLGSSVTPRYTKLSNIIPKRALPQQVLERIQRKTVSDESDGIDASSRGVSSLGKITLNLEQTKNNLEKILQIIAGDYKNTQEINRKEIDDYRKRVANRGRIFGKKELGDRKTDLLGGVKKYVSSFFSGTGGAIRALAAYNLLQAFIDRDPGKIIKSLLGIGITYLPAIGGMIAGGIATSLFGKIFKGARAAAPAAGSAAGGGAGALGRLGRFGGKAALVGGGLALASSIFNKPQEEGQQQRLEQLTQQQKGLTDTQNLVPIPQDDLKRFEKLNKKFEAALDFLINKKGERGTRSGSSGGGSSQSTPNLPQNMMGGPGVEGLSDFIAGAETGGRFTAFSGDDGRGDPNITSMTLSQLKAKYPNTAVGAHQFKPDTAISIARSLGMDPNKTVFTPEVQRALNIAHLNQMGYGDYVSGKISKEEFGKRIAQQYRALPVPGTGATFQDQYASSNRALRTDFQFLQALEASKTGATPGMGVSPRSSPSRVATLPPSRQQQSVILAPAPVQQQQQASISSGGNEIIPGDMVTTYSENFLTLYSKLIYQVV